MDMATVQAFSDAREGTGKTFTGVGLGNAAPAARPPAPGQLSRARSPGSPAAASGPCSSRSRQSCTRGSGSQGRVRRHQHIAAAVVTLRTVGKLNRSDVAGMVPPLA